MCNHFENLVVIIIGERAYYFVISCGHETEILLRDSQIVHLQLRIDVWTFSDTFGFLSFKHLHTNIQNVFLVKFLDESAVVEAREISDLVVLRAKLHENFEVHLKVG